ncbi:MAG: DUF1127 domain-containing protein [Pseudomonadota bacterium]
MAETSLRRPCLQTASPGLPRMLLQTLRAYVAHLQTQRQLRALPEHLLKDNGLTRAASVANTRHRDSHESAAALEIVALKSRQF